MASATAAGNPGRGLTHKRPSPTCGAGATRLAFGSYAGSVLPVSGGAGSAGGGGGAAGGGVGSRFVDAIVGPFARISRVPGTNTIESPASCGSMKTYVALRHGACQSTVKNSTTAIT